MNNLNLENLEITLNVSTFYLNLKTERARHICWYENFNFRYREPYSTRDTLILFTPTSFSMKWWDGATRVPEIVSIILPDKSYKEYILRNWKFSAYLGNSIEELFSSLFRQIISTLGYFKDTKTFWKKLLEIILEDYYYDNYKHTYIKTIYYKNEMDEIRKKRIVEAIRYNIALAQLLEELKIHERKKEYFRCESCGNLVEAKVDLYNWIEKGEKIYLVCNVCRTRGF